MVRKLTTESHAAEMEAIYRKRTIGLSLLLAAAASFSVINYYITFGLSGPSRMPPVLIAGIFIALGCAWLAQQGRIATAVTILIATIFSAIGFSMTQSYGIGIYLSVFAGAMSLGVISQTLPPIKFRNTSLYVVAATVVLILLDLFYPLPRTVTVNQTAAIVLTGTVIVVVAILIGREFPRYALSTKLGLTFLVIAAVPLTVLAAFTNATTQRLLTTQTQDSLLSTANQAANRIDTLIENELASIASEATLLGSIVGEQNLLMHEARGQITNILTAFQSKEPTLIQSYALLDRAGRVVIDTTPDNVGHNESTYAHFTEAMATGRPYASSVEFVPDGPLEDTMAAIHFSHVVTSGQGEVVGVLRARYSAAVLQQIAAESSALAGEQIHMAVYDRNGFTLAHSMADERRYKFLTWPEPSIQYAMRVSSLLPPGFQTVDRVENNPELAAILNEVDETSVFTVMDTAVGDIPQLAAVAASSTQPWLIITFQPQPTLAAPTLAQTRTITLVSMALVGLAVVTGLFVSGQLVRPLLNLRQTAEQITAGDLDARASVVSQDEFGTLGYTFNSMAEQLQQSLAFLEARVAERTRALEVASQVSRSLSTILDPDQLVKTVVDQVQTSFDYYHAHIYLLDEKENSLRMVGGTGQAGQAMLQQGHQIPYGKGLVGRAAATNNVVLIPNVADDPNWLANPLLPDTQAEVAVPIALGSEVLGVLDVQHNKVNGLSTQDANLLQAVANQVAIALQNAREYQKAQARAERQQLLNEINQKIQMTQDMEGALQIAVREIGQAVGAKRVRARLTPASVSNGRKET